MGWLSRIWRRPPSGGAGASDAAADEPAPARDRYEAPAPAVASESPAPTTTPPEGETLLDEVAPDPEIAARREKARGPTASQGPGSAPSGGEPVADSTGRRDEDLDVEAAIAMDAVGELPEDWDLIRDLAPGQELASFLRDQLDSPFDPVASGLVGEDALDEEELRWWENGEDEDDVWGGGREEEEGEDEEEDWEEEGDDELMW